MTTRKSKRGVLVTVEIEPAGAILRLDDVQQGSEPGMWNQREHVTHKKISIADLKEMRLSESELADFASFVLARLNAYIDVGES